ncbi:DUF6597 domain-containing transcriptional factor [Alkalicoccobacillus gibsonii]|uniref:DUF6597 domain-containing transcriptional factor n=1 Tax=Alkalicoccobacillus gibsonii TaxID=79881 RepID=UPI003511C1A8
MNKKSLSRFLPVQAPILEQTNDEHYQYHEYPPSVDLASYVACFWTVHFDGKSIKPHRIVPDGCVDLIFDLADPATSHAFLSGLMTDYALLSFHSPIKSFGVRFYSDSAARLMRIPVSELTREVSIHDLWGSRSQEMIDAMAEASSVRDQIKLIEGTLRERFDGLSYKPESLLEKSMAHLLSRHGVISIKELAAIEHYSERTIRRAFKDELGISPKEMIELIRFQFLLQELNSDGAQLINIAGTYGYYDQSHLTNQFKRYYGMAPSRVLENRTST